MKMRINTIAIHSKLIKYTHWEFMPTLIVYIPIIVMMIYFAIKTRRIFFFSAVNPVIETGGMWGESKFNILKRIPDSHVPPTIFVKQGTDYQYVIQRMKEVGMREWPVIVKPDIGERGLLVTKINDEMHLQDFLNNNSVDLLIQGLVEMPLELAVLCYRMPGSENVTVSSICLKETLKVKGDGHSSIKELMLKSKRAILQIARFEKDKPELLKKVPPDGQILELEPIGNHCRGTMFLNGNRHIDAKLTQAFGSVLSKMDDIYYGRFDLKCESIEHLRSTGEFKTVEFNGIGAEPAHIYDPSYPVWKKYRDMYRHWHVIYQIYKIQFAKQIAPMSLTEGIERLRVYRHYMGKLGN